MKHTMVLTGDVNLRHVTDPSRPFSHVADALKAADVVFGNLERTREDVDIRSHGSRHEATVPILCYGREVDASLYRRNIDLTRNFVWDA